MGSNDKSKEGVDNELNIFEEFNSNDKLKKEIEEINEEKKKDFYYYSKGFLGFFKVINLLLVLFFGILYVYFYIQDKEDLGNSEVLNPACEIFLGEVFLGESSCSSISYAINKAKNKISLIKEKQFIDLINILPDVYSSINWFEGEEISFLLEKTSNRLRPMDIIEEFDILKNSFEGDDKKKITCSDFLIKDDYSLTAKCFALSRGYENKIVGFDGTKVELVSGTSNSLAASFLNFINKSSKGKFTLIKAQSEFISSNILKDGYTNQTTFTLNLQYNSDNLLFNK